MSTDPRRTIGTDLRRFTVDAEARARLEALAARTGGIVDIEAGASGITLRHTSATGRVREAAGQTADDAVRALAADLLGAGNGH